MGVTELLARWAVRTPHVFLVEVPGYGDVRMRVETALRSAGGRIALSAAEADVLLTCGAPGPELAALIDRVWGQLPGPRVRTTVETPDAVEQALAQALLDLGDDTVQRADAQARHVHPDLAAPADHDGMDHAGMDHGGMDEGDPEPMDHGGMDEGDPEPMDHGGMDHAGMDHGGMDHAGMDHGDMDMPEPGGIPLAGGGEDRDGLEMDVLNVPLGPLLPHWPAGLVVWCVLQGDVIVSAEARVMSAVNGVARVTNQAPAQVRALDRSAQVLALAGWSDAESATLLLRDRVAVGESGASGAVEALHRRVQRSRSLRWNLRGLSVHGVDLRDILLAWLNSATDAVPQTTADATTEHDERAKLESIPNLITGAEFSTARLLIAGLGLNTDVLAATETSGASQHEAANHDGGHHG